jgi:hypothetical protein
LSPQLGEQDAGGVAMAATRICVTRRGGTASRAGVPTLVCLPTCVCVGDRVHRLGLVLVRPGGEDTLGGEVKRSDRVVVTGCFGFDRGVQGEVLVDSR